MLFTLLAFCGGNPPVTDGFPSKSASKQALKFSLMLAFNKMLNKQLVAGEWRHLYNGQMMQLLQILTMSMTLFIQTFLLFQEMCVISHKQVYCVFYLLVALDLFM